MVEAILATAVFGLFVTALSGIYLYGEESTALSGSRARAVLLAEEGLEAVRNIRDDDFSNLSDGTHGLAQSGNVWILSGSSDVTDIFTRAITISTVDANRKNVTSTVTWQQNAQRNGSVSLIERLTHWQEVVSVTGDWSSPTTTDSYDVSGGNNGWKVDTVGDYVYLVRVSGNPDFVIFDISDPDNPSLESSLNLSGGPEDVMVVGDYAYVASDSNSQELQIIDVSNPSSPSLEGSYNAPGNSNMWGVYVSGSYAYLSRDSSGGDEFYVVDVSTPSSPSLEDSINLGSDGNEVYVSGSHAYVASDSNSQELQVIDISTPSNVSLVGSLNLTGNDNAEAIDGTGTTLVIGRSSNSGYTHTIDISTPTSPSLLGTYFALDDVRDVTIGGDYAFLATDRNDPEFQVIDISTPASPTLFGSLNISNDLNGITYSEDHDRAYAAGDDNSSELWTFAPQ